ncbi:MAG: hypothetical protein HY326_12410 [Chloroflexi bacterium]|nr:hypothetical protein [Chloroflexota bacterium]
MLNDFNAFIEDEGGQSITEYAVLTVVILGATTLTIIALGTTLKSIFQCILNQLQGQACTQ